MKQTKLKVKLIAFTNDPEETVTAAIRQCYSAVGAEELKEKTSKETQERLIKQVIGSGHTSTLEHASFTFAIEGISRVTEIQLIRHRVGNGFSIQSGRYVDRSEVSYRIPPSIEKLANKKLYKKYVKHLDMTQALYQELIEVGVPKEDARYCQPQSMQTKLVLTMNARSLLHFFELRCCRRAQWEIQALANAILAEVRKVAPIIFEKAGPACMTLGICWEGKLSCGLWEKIPKAEVRGRN